MDENEARAYFQRYKQEVEAITSMLFDIGSKGDVNGLDWAIQCFTMCAQLAKNHIELLHREEAPDLVKFERFQ